MGHGCRAFIRILLDSGQALEPRSHDRPGYIYTNYDKYECATCGKFKGSQDKHYFGPTKAGISLIYIIK